MEEAIHRVVDTHFSQRDCARDCVEVNMLRAKVNNAFMIISILLGSLLSLNGVIFLQVYSLDKSLTSKVASIETMDAGIKQRLDQHRQELTTIEGWHLNPKGTNEHTTR